MKTKNYAKLIMLILVATLSFGGNAFALEPEFVKTIKVNAEDENLKMSEEDQNTLILQKERQQRKDELGGITFATDGDNIKYLSNLNDFVKPRQLTMSSEDISEEIISEAKLEAIESAGHDYDVKSQTVEKRLDNNFKPYLEIKTVFVDDNEAYFADFYCYHLD